MSSRIYTAESLKITPPPFCRSYADKGKLEQVYTFQVESRGDTTRSEGVGAGGIQGDIDSIRKRTGGGSERGGV